jgi:hypothetical protein
MKGVMFALEKGALHRWIMGRRGENTDGEGEGE